MYCYQPASVDCRSFLQALSLAQWQIHDVQLSPFRSTWKDCIVIVLHKLYVQLPSKEGICREVEAC